MRGILSAAAPTRRRHRSIIVFAICCLVLLIGAAPPVNAHGKSHKSQLKIFGDSLSDSGNAAALGAPINLRPFEGLIPDGPYFTLRFSNGRTWVERLANRLGTPDSGKAAFVFAGAGGNYAVGGGRARDVSDTFDLPEQVGFFLSGSDGTMGPKDWAVIQFGGNDVRDAIAAFVGVLSVGGTPEAANAAAAGVICEAVANIELNIGLLYEAAGAKRFLVVSSPDLGITPAVRALGASELGTGLSQLFNALLVLGDTGACGGAVQGLLNLQTSLPESEIVLFDVFALLNEVVADPEKFGLSNGVDSCITPGVFIGAVCHRPSHYVFWDGIHPTAAMHRIVARRAFYTLLGVSWGHSEHKHSPAASNH